MQTNIVCAPSNCNNGSLGTNCGPSTRHLFNPLHPHRCIPTTHTIMASHSREFSDESAASHDTTLSQDARIFSFSEPQTESSSDNNSTYETLRRNLSARTVVSTSSSFAHRMERAKAAYNSHLAVIGRGTCGTVFEIAGTETAIKKGSDKQGLWVDANLTNVACRAVVETKALLESMFPGSSIPRVPQVYGWVRDEELEKWWEVNRSRFPDQDNATGYLFQVQRILPISKATRTALIKNYFPKEFHESSLADPSNKACLVRPYLGMRRSDHEFDHPAETLQNFPLHLDQMEDIELDIALFSREIAIGLAVIHWRAGLDGMDVEFVLGSSAIGSELPPIVEHFESVQPFSIPAGDFTRRQTHLWMLDFDKASKLDFNDWKKTRQQMVTAVTANDPYFPNPATSGESEELTWSAFEAAYLQAADALLKIHPTLSKKARAKKYPEAFLVDWKKRAQSLEETKDGGFIQFST
ncbi:hypothetical protein COCMIDRAFT_97946 [Bipolaris oryzae ATCC 44560]|uniref:DUF3669 domain-containing protein n=1 Tax=Bipolaris oryzae ATCC 44560 TaxID=930090 RepID=W6ZAH0_COCMI|nr:uncharacterized protein COCMIDRAFT_97946 [Bipolaris oryzae ATCC 44560]EUC44524.1 hypothetical protein COCMIDRAFT_97946 [Bipolaris oryzae ATCC 44560]